jgi:hypothetical protein
MKIEINTPDDLIREIESNKYTPAQVGRMIKAFFGVACVFEISNNKAQADNVRAYLEMMQEPNAVKPPIFPLFKV